MLKGNFSNTLRGSQEGEDERATNFENWKEVEKDDRPGVVTTYLNG